MDFGLRSLEVRVLNLGGKNFKLRVPKTHHTYNNEKSKFIVKENKIVVSIHKSKKDDNWFTLHKQEMIGESIDDK